MSRRFPSLVAASLRTLREAWGNANRDAYTAAPKMNAFTLLLMATAVLLGVFLRLDGLGRPVWVDEVYTINWAYKTVSEILAGNNSPLQPLLAKLVVTICSSDRLGDEVFLRMVSALWGNLTLVFLFLFMYRKAGTGAAFVSTLFLATLRAHINISLEARYYALQILLALLLIIVIDRFLITMWLRDLIAPVLVATLGLLNHMSFAFLWAACVGCAGLCVLANLGSPVRKRLITAACLAAISALPFVFVVATHPDVLSKSFAQAEGAAADGESAPAEAPKAAAATYRLSPSEYFSFLIDDPEFLWLGSGLLCAFFLLIVLAGLFSATRTGINLPILLLGILLIPIPFMLIPTNQPWHSRYFTTQFPAFAILLGFGVVSLRTLYEKRGGQRPLVSILAVVVLAVIVCAAILPTRVRQYPDRWTALVRHQSGFETLHALAQEIHAGDALILAGPMWPTWSCHTIVRYYTSDAADGEARMPFGTAIYYRWNTQQILDVLAARKPEKDMWVIAPSGRGEEQKTLAENGGTLLRSKNGTTLWSFGRATVNMLPNGDFEADSAETQFPPTAAYASGDEAWQGGRSLKVTLPTATEPPAPPKPVVWLPVLRSGIDASPATHLDNGAVYSLSFRMRCEGIQAGKKPEQDMQVVLAWEGGKQALLPIQGHLDWNKYSGNMNFGEVPEWKYVEITIEPGRNVPADLKNVMIGFANQGALGTFWLDDVQLERGAPSSPFTLDVRSIKP